ncbi:hypothetical protein AD934_05100 [Gluconobacter oxydans]|uniref:Uncharacterized protein n=1 Tax=Gluconobacter oxydans TaxID=442 RepID=A0A149RXU4_GLUOY|nr:hypothetical protein AD934_05100 [Gluconobacter oxydans]
MLKIGHNPVGYFSPRHDLRRSIIPSGAAYTVLFQHKIQKQSLSRLDALRPVAFSQSVTR